MRDIKLIILVIVLVLLFGGSFYLAEKTVKSHLSYADANFQNTRGARQFKQAKRLRLTKVNRGQQQAKVKEAPPEIIVMSADTSGVYVLADMGADAPQGGPTDRDEKQPNQSLEKENPTESERKSDWEINVLPVQPPDNVKSLPEMNDENKQTPSDRF